MAFQFGVEGGDDEAAESGAEMVVRFGIFGRRGMVAEMLAVVRITLFPLGTKGGVFQNDRRLSDRFAETGACRSLFRWGCAAERVVQSVSMCLAVPRTQNDTAFPAQLAAERIEFNTGCDFRHMAVE